MHRLLKRSSIAILGLLLLTSVGRAQKASADWDAERFHMTRDGLTELLSMYEDAARSQAYSGDLRARARYEADLIRARLEEGDFQVGDRIVLQVEGEVALTDTFTVAPGHTLKLPLIGDISLGGVLRSELEQHLRSEIGRYIRDPVLRAQSLIRISVLGEIARPGYYVVPSESLLTDVLMVAGGPGPEARLTELRVERGNNRIWEGEPLQQAIIEGRTLDQLSLRAGDSVVIPTESRRSWLDVIRTVAVILPAAFALSRLF